MYNKTHKESVQSNPSAHITVRKGRVKIYDKEKQPSKIYLQGGQEFEIELFNPTTLHQLATIEINGKLISNTGIALKPGQRVYLERYLDVAKKFKFDTYDVESGNASVEKAIALNGFIKIKFYSEVLTPKTTFKTTSSPTWINYNYPLGGTTLGGTGLSGTITTTASNSTITLDSTNISSDWNQCSTYTCSVDFDNTFYDATLNYLSDSDTTKSVEFENPIKEEVKMKETGRVEQGSSSSQSFDYIDMDFSTWANTTIEYQILPLSEKVVETKDLKNYCTECGRGLKPEFKFCPVCGTKV